jgi:acyl-CoA synthetase (NDP forming)
MMELFFKPKSVAVIGASGSPGKLGYVIVQNIAGSDFSGKVYPVNPKSEEILGYKVYKSVSEIPGEVDLVVTALPTPKMTVAAVEECAAKGVKAIIIESAGFAEMGGDGKLYQEQIVDIAKKERYPGHGAELFRYRLPGYRHLNLPDDQKGSPGQRGADRPIRSARGGDGGGYRRQ